MRSDEMEDSIEVKTAFLEEGQFELPIVMSCLVIIAKLDRCG